MPRLDRLPLEGPFTATANDPAVDLEVPKHNYSEERMVLLVDESEGPVEIVVGDATVGQSVPTTTADGEDFPVGRFRLASAAGTLKAYAASGTAFTYHWTKI